MKTRVVSSVVMTLLQLLQCTAAVSGDQRTEISSGQSNPVITFTGDDTDCGLCEFLGSACFVFNIGEIHLLWRRCASKIIHLSQVLWRSAPSCLSWILLLVSPAMLWRLLVESCASPQLLSVSKLDAELSEYQSLFQWSQRKHESHEYFHLGTKEVTFLYVCFALTK